MKNGKYYIDLFVFRLQPDLCAPGVEIPVPCIRDNYTISTGTSFACPLVAGKAAIIKHEFEKKGIKLSPASIKSALMTTTGKRNF